MNKINKIKKIYRQKHKKCRSYVVDKQNKKRRMCKNKVHDNGYYCIFHANKLFIDIDKLSEKD